MNARSRDNSGQSGRNWKRTVVAGLARIHLLEFVMACKNLPNYLWVRLVRRRKIARYLGSASVKKLHLGAGPHVLPGWLNTDIGTLRDGSVFLDVCETFPLANDEFDCIYSEHLIEHVTYPNGLAMLRECFRVLRPNGKIRIATPNLTFLSTLCSCASESQKPYLQWATDVLLQETTEYVGAPAYGPAFVVNRAVRDWGHRFIYDRQTLAEALGPAGFVDIHFCDVGCSDDDRLANLENKSRMPAGLYRMETMIVEGTKPRRLNRQGRQWSRILRTGP